jgi:hypothetical protein
VLDFLVIKAIASSFVRPQACTTIHKLLLQ